MLEVKYDCNNCMRERELLGPRPFECHIVPTTIHLVLFPW